MIVHNLYHVVVYCVILHILLDVSIVDIIFYPEVTSGLPVGAGTTATIRPRDRRGAGRSWGLCGKPFSRLGLSDEGMIIVIMIIMIMIVIIIIVMIIIVTIRVV